MLPVLRERERESEKGWGMQASGGTCRLAERQKDATVRVEERRQLV